MKFGSKPRLRVHCLGQRLGKGAKAQGRSLDKRIRSRIAFKELKSKLDHSASQGEESDIRELECATKELDFNEREVENLFNQIRTFSRASLLRNSNRSRNGRRVRVNVAFLGTT